VLFIGLEDESAYVNWPWKHYSTSVSRFFQKNFDTSHRDNPAVSLFQLATNYLHAKVSFQVHCFLQAGSPALRMSP
jgi:hypothetical protein